MTPVSLTRANQEELTVNFARGIVVGASANPGAFKAGTILQLPSTGKESIWYNSG